MAATPDAAGLAAPLGMPEAEQDAIFRAQPAHIQHILTVIQRIAGDAKRVAELLQQGALQPWGGGGHAPIYCQGIERLFKLANTDGSTSYRSYYYTEDLKTMDPKAQLHLSQFFGRVMAVNTVLTAAPDKQRAARMQAVPGVLDSILVEALYFKGFFSAFAISRSLLTTPQPGQTTLAEYAALIARTKADLAAAAPQLHDAAAAFAALPKGNPSLLVELIKAY
ncbi:hypothetical protein [Pseudorhodobacter sp. E13]|uniref:hypothetical protein n=1 Tax=Pseudorhodobacter sp. E13 TaxID=2487931 RepID=UPI000F8C54A4|nr:hypothetical protein [Pseudorhodobacter sp. E13]